MNKALDVLFNALQGFKLPTNYFTSEKRLFDEAWSVSSCPGDVNELPDSTLRGPIRSYTTLTREYLRSDV